MYKSLTSIIALLLLSSSALHAQDYSGTYTIQGDASPVTLSLSQNAQGHLSGHLTGSGIAYEVTGAPEAPGISGSVSDGVYTLPFVARLQGDHLYFKLFEINPDGQPNYATARTLLFARQNTGSQSMVAHPPRTGQTSQPRTVVINGTQLPEERVLSLEQKYRTSIQDGRYWYDARCGAWGLENGPTVGFIPPGLDLPGPMPVDISGGDTNIFINGREIHFQDQMAIHQLLGVTYPGRYWLDAQGNLGIEGGQVLVNLVQASHRAGGSKAGITSGLGGTVGVDGTGGVMFSTRNASGGYTTWSN